MIKLRTQSLGTSGHWPAGPVRFGGLESAIDLTGDTVRVRDGIALLSHRWHLIFTSTLLHTLSNRIIGIAESATTTRATVICVARCASS